MSTAQIFNDIKEQYPEKFASNTRIFDHINRGDHLFIGTGCGQPQYLLRALVNYVEANPKAFFDVEIFHIPLGPVPYLDERFKPNFRHNAFFVGESTRNAINHGLADYTPIFLSQVSELFERDQIPLDVALIQTSLPDDEGYLSLGVSVDIVKTAVEKSALVIAQVNPQMPRVPGDTFIHLSEVDFVVPYDEPLLEYHNECDPTVAERVGGYIASLVEDGDTLQIGYGALPDAILPCLRDKKHLGLHTELMTDGLVALMQAGVIDNSQKFINPGRSVAALCVGSRETYAYLHENPAIEFRTADYTNNPLVIAAYNNMIAINSALEIDLTGQATAESLGKTFYSGIGGQADFMRGAALAQGGKAILALPSTAENGEVSRITPLLKEGVGVTLNRGDVQYVVTEYGIAFLHGKSIRERAMELIGIAHPKFRPWLIDEAKRLELIYPDQAFIPGDYPETLETKTTTRTGLELFLRPVKISDEPLLKDFFYSLSDESLYYRFMSMRKDIPHERLQEFVVIDYTSEMLILAIRREEEKETVIGAGQYFINEFDRTAELSMAVRDDYQGQGIGKVLLDYLVRLVQEQGLTGVTASVLPDNFPMLRLLEETPGKRQRSDDGTYDMKILFD